MIEACISSILLVGDVRVRQLRISFKCAPCVRSEERPYEIEYVSLRLAVLEQNEEGHAQERYNEFHKDVKRHPKHARAVTREVCEEIHQSRKCEYENQILEFE